MDYSFECPQCFSENHEDRSTLIIGILTFGFSLLLPCSCSACDAFVLPRWRNVPLFFVLVMLVIVPLYILLGFK